MGFIHRFGCRIYFTPWDGTMYLYIYVLVGLGSDFYTRFRAAKRYQGTFYRVS